MFIAAAAGGGLVWRASHGNYSDHSNYRDHSNHSQYGDAALRNAIDEKQTAINDKTYEVEKLRQNIWDNFNSKIANLKQEKKYPSLNSANPDDVIENVKADMKNEIANAINDDKKELEKIDEMIRRINELELNARQE